MRFNSENRTAEKAKEANLARIHLSQNDSMNQNHSREDREQDSENQVTMMTKNFCDEATSLATNVANHSSSHVRTSVNQIAMTSVTTNSNRNSNQTATNQISGQNVSATMNFNTIASQVTGNLPEAKTPNSQKTKEFA